MGSIQSELRSYIRRTLLGKIVINRKKTERANETAMI